MRIKLVIEGMSCGHCANHVKEALIEVEGVLSVEVDLEGKNAVIEITQQISEESLKNAVEEEAGYTLVKIENL